jgi:hypothetical protein
MESNPANSAKRSSNIAKNAGSNATADSLIPVHPPKLIGIGNFASGIPNLATNKKYMAGLGQSSMGAKHKSKSDSLPKTKG